MIADRHKRNRGRALFHLASMTGAEYDRLATINPRRWTDEELSLLQRRLNEAGLGLVSDALASVRMDKTDAERRAGMFRNMVLEDGRTVEAGSPEAMAGALSRS